VIATASADNVAVVKELGADVVVDYTSQRFEDVIRDVDVVLNVFDEEIFERSWSVLKPGGIQVSTLAYPTTIPDGLRAVRMFVAPNGEQIGELAKLLADGSLRSVVSQSFPLERIQDAFRARNAGHVVGKLVITL
jgi:NADPH:quinone reductase-like Zn-dependent oxidoreductase